MATCKPVAEVSGRDLTGGLTKPVAKRLWTENYALSCENSSEPTA